MKPIRKGAGELFDIHAQEYHDWMKSIHTYDSTLDVFCRLLKGKAILDVACGPGNITHYFLEKNSNYKVLGIDLAPKMIEIARINNPLATFKVMDINKVDNLDLTFDGIVCGFGLPYLNKEEAIQLIKNTSIKLHSKGILYLSTMEGDYSKSRVEASSSGKYEVQMYYHEGTYLKQALLEVGFIVILEERLKSVNRKGEEVIDLVLICEKI